MADLFISPILENFLVDEHIIEFEGKFLNTKDMTFIDSNPCNTFDSEEISDRTTKVTKYESRPVRFPLFKSIGYESRAPYVFIYENYAIAIGNCTLVNNPEGSDYNLINIYTNSVQRCHVWRIEATKKPKAAIRQEYDAEAN